MEPITVSVMSSDPVSGAGAVAQLQSCPQIRVLSVDSRHEADVVLILAVDVTEETLAMMERASGESSNRDMRIVLVGDGLREHQLMRAVNYGLVSVIPRREAVRERIVGAVLGVRGGRAELPEPVLGWLMGQIRAVQREVLAANGLTAAGLETREVRVLKLLADGLDTAEIAARMNFSERTIKNIIHGMLGRLKLRNRAHAVAYALRHGAL